MSDLAPLARSGRPVYGPDRLEPPRRGNGNGGDGARHGVTPAASLATIGVWLLTGAIAVMFISFTSTLLVRRAEADWQAMAVPPLLWANTAVLLASSAAIEWSRARVRVDDLRGLRLGLGASALLGAAFLTGQWLAWRQLVAAGVHMAVGAHASFFYLLTGAHAVHVAGGVAALAYVALRARWAWMAADAWRAAGPAAIYWHFVDGLWLYVFAVVFWL